MHGAWPMRGPMAKSPCLAFRHRHCGCVLLWFQFVVIFLFFYSGQEGERGAAGAGLLPPTYTTTTNTTTPRAHARAGRRRRPASNVRVRLLGVGPPCPSRPVTRAGRPVVRHLEGGKDEAPSNCNSHTAPHLYNTQGGLSPREVPFRSIDFGEVALRPYPTYIRKHLH